MKTTTYKTLYHLRSAWCLLISIALLLSATGAAFAFTTADRAAAYGAWKNAFYFTSNGRGYFRDHDGSSTVQWFWQFGSCMDVVNRAVQLGLDSPATVDALCQGFTNQYGLDWSWNTWNDDVSGMSRSLVGAYEITGDRTWLNLAKSGFDLGYSRGYVPANGGLDEYVCTTDCLEATETTDGIIIPCYMLSQYLPDSGYATKAQGLYNYLLNYTFNPTTGMVSGTPNSTDSSLATSDYGFFMQSAVLYGNTSYAQKAADYAWNRWGVGMNSSSDGASGFCLRAMGLTGINVSRAQQTINTAWSFRNSRGLTSPPWWYRLSDTATVDNYAAMQLVMGMLNVPPADTVILTINSATYAPVDGSNGGANVTNRIANNVSNNSLSLAVNNTSMGGDPAPGHVKQLTMICTVGEQNTVITPENSTINIRVESGQIVSARYAPVDGSNSGTDVTSLLTGNISNGTLIMSVTIPQWEVILPPAMSNS
ncbi:hypothetical protein [Pedosphaera parvula]|uniref:Uncharacterized protein n=1 Tax=Pedosphaera parvula (strain Ellin514) TaxID=320771 RepID=B9XRD2_PEDPL|nr:hypothetical protein [Pedosphaera parvula]EEF57619.1 hypothetical protein Cflav_PD0487 [Pedosphaera parvula Ellin514]